MNSLRAVKQKAANPSPIHNFSILLRKSKAKTVDIIMSKKRKATKSLYLPIKDGVIKNKKMIEENKKVYGKFFI